MREGKQTANASRALHRTTQIETTGIVRQNNTVRVALLDDRCSVVNVMRLADQSPYAQAPPVVIARDRSPAYRVIPEFSPPGIRDRYRAELIEIVVLKPALAIRNQISVEVVNEGNRGREKIIRDPGNHELTASIRDCQQEPVPGVGQSEPVRARKCTVAVKLSRQPASVTLLKQRITRARMERFAKKIFS